MERQIDLRNVLVWKLRITYGLTIDDIAILGGVSRETVVKWLNGQRAPDFKHQERFKLIFQTEISTLVKWAERDFRRIRDIIGKSDTRLLLQSHRQPADERVRAWCEALGIRAKSDSERLRCVLNGSDQLIRQLAATHVIGIKLMRDRGLASPDVLAIAAERILLSVLAGPHDERRRSIAKSTLKAWQRLKREWPELWDPLDVHLRTLHLVLVRYLGEGLAS